MTEAIVAEPTNTDGAYGMSSNGVGGMM